MSDTTPVPAVDGWFTTDADAPALVGTRCAACATVFFPGEHLRCRNPVCGGRQLDAVELSRTGTIWSYTDARYRPPPPFVPTSDDHEPFALAAVHLAAEGLVVLGQVVRGVGVGDLAVGDAVELTLETLFVDDEGREQLVWKWRPADVAPAVAATDPGGRAGAAGDPPSPAGGGTGGVPADGRGDGRGDARGDGGGDGGSSRPRASDPVGGAPAGERVTVAGVGMHPWGKWGSPFVEYGLVAAEEALADAGVPWSEVDFVAGADTIRNGYPGFVAGATFSQALGWQGNQVASCYAACASGAQALEVASTRIQAGRCEVALVIGADTTPKGFFAPVGGDRTDDPDWLRFRLLGATNPTYFALYARRRMALYGATVEDFAAVKAKNSRHGAANPNARYRKAVGVDDVLASPVVADPLHLLDICATSDGAAAVVLMSEARARRHDVPPVQLAAVSTVTPTFPQHILELPHFSTDSTAGVGPPPRSFRDAIAHAAYEEAGIGPGDLDLAEVYDLSTALELDWYENLGLCEPGAAEALLRSGATSLGGRVPVNPSGGLACFGEAIPAQALAQVCELTWQLRGSVSGGRQVDGATVGLAANQGLFGHGSAVVLVR